MDGLSTWSQHYISLAGAIHPPLAQGTTPQTLKMHVQLHTDTTMHDAAKTMRRGARTCPSPESQHPRRV